MTCLTNLIFARTLESFIIYWKIAFFIDDVMRGQCQVPSWIIRSKCKNDAFNILAKSRHSLNAMFIFLVTYNTVVLIPFSNRQKMLSTQKFSINSIICSLWSLPPCLAFALTFLVVNEKKIYKFFLFLSYIESSQKSSTIKWTGRLATIGYFPAVPFW